MLKEDEKARWLGWCGNGTNRKYVKPGFPCQNLVILAYLTFCRILDLQVVEGRGPNGVKVGALTAQRSGPELFD